MGWERQYGALLWCRRVRADGAETEVGAGLAALGFRLGGRGIRVQPVLGPRRGAGIVCALDPGLATVLAAHLARAWGAPVDLYTVVVQYAEGRKPACTCDERVVQVLPDGGSRPGELPASDWDDEFLDTDHPWRVAELSLDEVLSTWTGGLGQLGDGVTWSPPEPTGSPRLDRLLGEIRRALRAEVLAVEGREALQVHTVDGAVSTSFLEPGESAQLRAHVPSLG